MSWLLVRHFALTLNLKMNLKQGLLFPPSFLNESCDSDAEDELRAGLVDNPGTTRGTTLSVLQMNIGDCLLSSHQIFQLEVRLRH